MDALYGEEDKFAALLAARRRQAFLLSAYTDSTKDEKIEYKLVTSEESDVAAGKISTSSPIGRALLNKKVGDSAVVVTPNGNREMEILNLTTIHDQTEAQ